MNVPSLAKYQYTVDAVVCNSVWKLLGTYAYIVCSMASTPGQPCRGREGTRSVCDDIINCSIVFLEV